MADSSAAIGPIEFGAGRLAPLGVPVVPEVRITARPATAGGGSGVLDAGGDELAKGRVLAADRRPTKQTRPTPGVVHSVAELAVVDQARRALALHHLGHLGPSERRC